MIRHHELHIGSRLVPFDSDEDTGVKTEFIVVRKWFNRNIGDTVYDIINTNQSKLTMSIGEINKKFEKVKEKWLGSIEEKGESVVKTPKGKRFTE